MSKDLKESKAAPCCQTIAKKEMPMASPPSRIPSTPLKIPQKPVGPPKIPQVSRIPQAPRKSAANVRGIPSTQMAANILAKTSLCKGAINDAVCAARNKAKIPPNTDLRKLGFPGIPKQP